MDYYLNLALGILFKQLTNRHYDYGIWMAFPYTVGRSKPNRSKWDRNNIFSDVMNKWDKGK